MFEQFDFDVFCICRIRLDHVKCDTSAWPTCNKKAVDLKRKFECHLLPYRCHSVNEDAIRQVCPEEGNAHVHINTCSR